MWAGVERYSIDELVAADPTDGPTGRRRTFAIQVPELTSIAVHWHDYYELGFVLEGHADHVVNGALDTLSRGSVFLLSPADFHAIESTGSRPLVMVNAVLHPELVERTLESVRRGDPQLPWSVPELPSVDDDVRRIRQELMARRPGWDLLVESALTAAVVGLSRARGGDAVDGALVDGGLADGALVDQPSSAHVRRAVRYVEQHFREPLTLDQVAAVAHLSSHWFSEQFRRATGDSFQTYLKRRRLQFARALLESTELGVTEVCRAAGFNDLSYFGRAFREQYGVSPSEGARRVRAGERRAN